MTDTINVKLESMMMKTLVEMDAYEHGSEDMKDCWTEIKEMQSMIERREKMSKPNIDDDAKKDKSRWYMVKDINGMVLDWFKMTASAASVLVPPAFAMYMAYLSKECEENGILLGRDPVMKYGEKLYSQMGKYFRA